MYACCFLLRDMLQMQVFVTAYAWCFLLFGMLHMQASKKVLIGALLQSVFIVFQDKIRPGKNYTGSQLFDNGGAYYNVPGYLDNLKVSSCHTVLSTAQMLMP